MKISKSFGIKAVGLLFISIVLAIGLFAAPNNAVLASQNNGPAIVADLVVSGKATCEGSGGSWSGVTTTSINNLLFISGLFGTTENTEAGVCTYADGHGTAVGACGAGYIYKVEYSSNTPTGTTQCISTATAVPTNPFSQYKGGDEVSGPLKSNTTINCIGGYNCSVTFPADSCEGNCIAGPFLPDTSKNALPATGVHGTAYVQMFNKDSTPNTSGTFSVCFDTTGVTNPVLYQFVSGAWTSRVSGNTNPLCYSGSGGTGAFYLGGD